MKVIDQTIGKHYAMYHGDSCEVLQGLPDSKVGLCIFSPPFEGLYIYSDSIRDLGNCKDSEEFFRHYDFIIRELFRVTIPGRLCAVHCKDLPLYACRDGMPGLRDFPGDNIRHFEAAGWVFHSRVTIWKCPVTERERTNNNGLLHKTATRDRSQLRQGMADFLIVFRKPTSNGLLSDEPVTLDDGTGFDEYIGECDPSDNQFHPSPYARKKSAAGPAGRSIDIWRRYAEPVWWDINQTNVLNFKIARDNNDERHICPLQLDVIERAIQLWTNPNDIVLSPFGGIGSEGYVAVKTGRRAVLVELKESYYRQACANLERAERERETVDMVDLMEASE